MLKGEFGMEMIKGSCDFFVYETVCRLLSTEDFLWKCIGQLSYLCTI